MHTPPVGPSYDPDTDQVTFALPGGPGWTPERIWLNLRQDGVDAAFRREDGGWIVRIPRPPVQRLEYLVVVRGADGNHGMLPDPWNQRRVPGVFGEKSVLEFPGYRPPAWLDRDVPADAWHPTEVPVFTDERAGIELVGALQSPAGTGAADRLPLLVVHDGPEYVQYCGLLHYLAVLAQRDASLRCRVLLLSPHDRDRSYSASPAYSRALVHGLLPQATRQVTTSAVVGIGASLGALALLHAEAVAPGAFDGLYLQSGSYFQPQSDPMELGFRYFDRICRFVEQLRADPSALAGTAVAMNCGTGEENLANNRAMAHSLAAACAGLDYWEFPDGHTHTGWRDSLDPGLERLLRTVSDYSHRLAID